MVDYIVILFAFVLPLVAMAVSLYSLLYVRSLKKAAAKLSAMCRLAGKDVSYE